MSIIITESQFEVNQKHYPSFSFKELACQETGEIALSIDFLKELQKLRDAYGKPMIITSGYRSPKHSIEAKKSSPGYHTQGAIDCAVSGEDAIRGELQRLASLAAHSHLIKQSHPFKPCTLTWSR